MKWVLFGFLILCGFSGAQQDSSTSNSYLDYCFECVKALPISDECKVYMKVAHGIGCVKNTGDRECADFFMAIWLPASSSGNIDQLIDSMVACAVDSSEWNNASDEKAAELLTGYVQCIEPFLNQFKSQHNCN